MLLAISVAMMLPLVLVARPPMQDFPVHFATLRVLHDFHDPAYGFDRTYELTLARTQYLGFYAVGHLLAYVVGVRGALVLLVGAYLVGTLHGLRALLRALGRDEDLAYLVVPILYGPLFALGLLPFLVAIPPMLFGIAGLVRRHGEDDSPPSRHVLVATMGTLLFYLHVLHLGVFLLAALLLFPWRKKGPGRTASALSLAPPVILLAWWVFGTNVGRRVLDVGARWGSTNRPALHLALADLHPWLADSYRDVSDEIVMALALACAFVAAMAVFREHREKPVIARPYPLLPLVAFLLYVTGEREHGAIWPLAQRWALIWALLAIPLLGFPVDPPRRRPLAIAAIGIALLGIGNAAWHFVAFDRETAELPRAFGVIGENKKVAMLAYDRRAAVARFEPLMHAVSYYQAEHGGVVAFSFAGFDHWPIDFRRGQYPIWDGPFTPRWESMPDVADDQPLGAFDFLLVRDRGHRGVPAGFHEKWHEDRWEVFEADPKTPGSGR